MTQVKEKKKKKTKGKKILLIIAGILLFLTVAAVIFVQVTTRPQPDTQEDKYIVGGMIYSDTVEYQSESGAGIRHNPIVRIMQMVWRFCQDGDEAKHAAQTPPANIVKHKDIPYIDDGNMFHLLDVYYPEGLEDGDRLSVIVDIHGGGWMYADKNLNEYYCLELARKGYVVFNISYRLVPDVVVTDQLQDCAVALKWIGEHMADYPCDSHSIMLTGDSAGGQLAVYSAVLLQSPELREAFGTVDAGLKITALTLTSPVPFMKDGGMFSLYTKPMWGSDIENTPLYNYMDLNEIIDSAQLPPTYLITSGGDALAHDQTVRAYELLKEKGVNCQIVDFGDDENGDALPHVFSVLFPFDKAGQEAIDGALAFYQEAIINQ